MRNTNSESKDRIKCSKTFGKKNIKKISTTNINPYVFLTCDDLGCKIPSSVIKTLRYLGVYGLKQNLYYKTFKNAVEKVKKKQITDEELENGFRNYRNNEQNIEIRTYELTNEMLKNKVCPHFVRMIDNFVCHHKMVDVSIDQIEDVEQDRLSEEEKKEIANDKNMTIKDGKLTMKDYFNKYVTLLELEYFKLGTLAKTVKFMDKKTAFSILFQLHYAIMCLQKYKGHNLKHNDLHFNNVLLESTPHNQKYQYVVNGQIFVVPTYGYSVKLFDYDFVYGDGFENLKVRDTQYESHGISPESDMIYDLIYVFGNFEVFKIYFDHPYKKLKVMKNRRLILGQDFSNVISTEDFMLKTKFYNHFRQEKLNEGLPTYKLKF